MKDMRISVLVSGGGTDLQSIIDAIEEGRLPRVRICQVIASRPDAYALERAKIMKESSDGFRIAEEDLRLRGPGELFGTRQHGLPERMISDLVRHRDVLEKAGRAAEEILEEDPSLTLPEHEELRIRVRKMFHGLERLEM